VNAVAERSRIRSRIHNVERKHAAAIGQSINNAPKARRSSDEVVTRQTKWSQPDKHVTKCLAAAAAASQLGLAAVFW